MNKFEIIERLKNIAGHAVHTVGEEPFVMSLDDGIAVREAIELLEKPETSCSEIPNSSDTISRQAAIDKITKRLFETAFNNVGIKQDIDETLVDVAENRLENWFNELPPIQPERKKPVFKTGESVYHVSYADGTGGFEKNKWADWTCPDCGWFVGEQYIPRRRNQQKCNYCAKCGCAIDWSDADMRREQE